MIKKILSILLFSVFLYGDATNIKPQCIELYKNYVEFRRKSIDIKEVVLKERWIFLYKTYKKQFDECQYNTNYKSFMRSNPLD